MKLFRQVPEVCSYTTEILIYAVYCDTSLEFCCKEGHCLYFQKDLKKKLASHFSVVFFSLIRNQTWSYTYPAINFKFMCKSIIIVIASTSVHLNLVKMLPLEQTGTNLIAQYIFQPWQY
jgi:hypothetical protein